MSLLLTAKGIASFYIQTSNRGEKDTSRDPMVRFIKVNQVRVSPLHVLTTVLFISKWSFKTFFTIALIQIIFFLLLQDSKQNNSFFFFFVIRASKRVKAILFSETDLLMSKNKKTIYCKWSSANSPHACYQFQTLYVPPPEKLCTVSHSLEDGYCK